MYVNNHVPKQYCVYFHRFDISSDLEPLLSDDEDEVEDDDDASSFVMLDINEGDEKEGGRDEEDKEDVVSRVGVQRAPVFISVQEAWNKQFDRSDPLCVAIAKPTTAVPDEEILDTLPSSLRGVPAHALAIEGECFVDSLLRHTFAAIQEHNLPSSVPRGSQNKIGFANELLAAVADNVLPDRYKLDDDVIVAVKAQMRKICGPLVLSKKRRKTASQSVNSISHDHDAVEDRDDSDDDALDI